MAFNFLQGARPAAALRLLFIQWPVIPSGLGLVSSYRLGFKHTASLPQQRQRVPDCPDSVPPLSGAARLSCTSMSLSHRSDDHNIQRSSCAG